VITVSYDTFFNNNYSNVRGYVYKIVRNLEDSDELVMDAFMHVFDKWITFNEETHARKILFICAKHYSLNYLKHQNRDSTKRIVEFQDWMDLGEHEVVEIEFYDIMLNSLHALPPERRKAFLMLLEGMTRAEVAEELGISIHTVKNHRIQAIKSIQTHLKNKNK
jgi:RNA polymerase sigma factor (sigma-70 family)